MIESGARDPGRVTDPERSSKSASPGSRGSDEIQVALQQGIDNVSHPIFGSFGVFLVFFGGEEIPGSTGGGKAGPTARRGPGGIPELLVGVDGRNLEDSGDLDYF